MALNQVTMEDGADKARGFIQRRLPSIQGKPLQTTLGYTSSFNPVDLTRADWPYVYLNYLPLALLHGLRPYLP